MKLADLQLAIDLQHALARLDELNAGAATLAIDGVAAITLDADEIAAFLDWRRLQLHRQLRELGVDPEIAAEAPPPTQAARQRPRRPDRAARLAQRAVRAPAARAASPKAKPMTLPQATAEARRRILEPIEAELRKNGGYLDDPSLIASDLAAMAERRAGDIAELARELMRGPQPPKPCCLCAAPANTIIAGLDYCNKHAKTARRPTMPELAA